MDIKKYPRTCGFVLFAIGASLSVWYDLKTIDRAANRSADVIAIPHAFAILVAFATLGLAMIIFGEKMQAYSKSLKDRKKTIKDFLIIGLFVAPGIGADFFLKYQLAQLGYN